MSSISPCAYAVITDRIIESLEKGVVPWHRPWAGGESPRNLCSGKAYRGINTFLLSASAAQAQKAADFILGRSFDEAESGEQAGE